MGNLNYLMAAHVPCTCDDLELSLGMGTSPTLENLRCSPSQQKKLVCFSLKDLDVQYECVIMCIHKYMNMCRYERMNPKFFPTNTAA